MENCQEKLKKLEYLINQIKTKLEILVYNKNELLKLNIKIKALIVSLKTCIPKQNFVDFNENSKENNNMSNNTTYNNCTNTQLNSSNSETQELKMERSTNFSVLESSFLPLKESTFFDISSFEKPIQKETRNFSLIIENMKKDVKFTENAKKIVNLLKKSGELSLENIIRNSGVSKYRCIEIINELTKIKPSLLRKKNVDGIKYYLNTQE